MVFGDKVFDPNRASAGGQLVERSVAFAQGNDLLLVGKMGQQLSESPDAALIEGQQGLPAPSPEGFEGGCGEGSRTPTVARIPSRIYDFEQVGTGGAAKPMAGVVGSKTADNASQFRYLHWLGGSQIRHSVY